MTAADLSALIKAHPLKLACGLLALLLAPGIYILSGRIDDAETLFEQKSAEGARLASNVRNAALLPDQVSSLAASTKKIEERLIHASQLANNLQYFYQQEAESGIELIDIRQTSGTVQKNRPGSSYMGIGFAVTVKGTYPVLLNWLRRLENGKHYCRILSFSTGTSRVKREAPLDFNLSIELLGQP